MTLLQVVKVWMEERIKTEGEHTHEALAGLKASISLKVHVQCITRSIHVHVYEPSKVARSVQLHVHVMYYMYGEWR